MSSSQGAAAQPAVEPAPGDVLGRYRLEQLAGAGGFASVYRATHLDDGRAVAVKVLHGRRFAGHEDVVRFEREVQMLARLQHPNIVSFIDSGVTDQGLPYLVLEYLQGQPLSAKIRAEGAVGPWRAGQIALQVLAALSAAHGLGIVHRDIKPANIFLCSAGEATVRVLDFGIAKVLAGEGSEGALTRLTRTGEIIGTPYYMAPEQVRGQETITGAVDVYAMGLVLAELLTGRRPVTGTDAVSVYMTHVSKEPIRLTDAVTDSIFAPIVARACAKDVASRYGSAAEMHADLEREQRRLYHVMQLTR